MLYSVALIGGGCAGYAGWPLVSVAVFGGTAGLLCYLGDLRRIPPLPAEGLGFASMSMMAAGAAHFSAAYGFGYLIRLCV
jgi:hypothetical protein